jgi:hypothetical protein
MRVAALTLLVAATVVLWLSTTLRHLLARSTTSGASPGEVVDHRLIGLVDPGRGVGAGTRSGLRTRRGR